ncbi:lipocalin/fatty acid-binding family protein [Tropicibacter oceani]|uniref:Lipocalin family protein n=1 Tax=Tropicibacter oceani TaxID=3058420 RepID=A0ABY8QER6_9RHOB|nr:lipocalin family protein [Tropicibacter oceani]WGW02938.1 lipocalin family protein [Tropicibacter oceani]
MRALWGLVLLAGCAAKAPLPEVPVPLRNPTVQVASQADATLDRLQGDWIVLQGAGMPAGSRLRIDGQGVQVNGTRLSFVPEGYGRFRLGEQAVWVHWLDADNRTAALGDPAGGRVWIMDRGGKPAERLAAAREILEWYGYDLSRMEAK